MKNSDIYRKLPDEQLWSLVITKDKVAFAQLYQRYYTPLLAYARSFRYDEDTAKDCIQDLFVKIFLSENLYPIEHVRAYLYKSFRNLLLNQLSLVNDSIEIEETPTNNFLVDDQELIKLFEKGDDYLQKSRQLMNACNQLPENQKNAIYLYYIKEFSWEEMASSLGISTHSCMNLIGRSIAKLKKLIG